MWVEACDRCKVLRVNGEESFLASVLKPRGSEKVRRCIERACSIIGWEAVIISKDISTKSNVNRAVS